MPDTKTVELFDGGQSVGTATVDGSGNWSKALTLSAGSHALTGKATDLAGNESGASSTVNLKSGDSTTPTLPDLLDDSGSSSSDNVTNDSTPRIESSITLTGPNSVQPPDATMSRYEVERKTGSGSWSKVVDVASSSMTITGSVANKKWAYTLQEGSALSNATHQYRARWKDKGGGYSSYGSTLSVVVDTTAPSSPAITSHSNGYVFTGTGFTIAGTSS
jgi:hypothetical protein